MTGHKRTALVVGASRGLGLGLATELARRGWQVIATVRSAVPADLAAAVAKSSGRISTSVVDVDSIASTSQWTP
jgi:NAD(P)-dependent dehydrogenase (short-subunit alcohol dehydrogenase family)